MYSTRPNLVYGFHGCDEEIRDKIVSGKDVLYKSHNDYDWLGNGVYFWENNLERAYEYAHLLKRHPERCRSRINNPSVVGAVIDLGHCLDLLDSSNLKLLQTGYGLLVDTCGKTGTELPQNKPIGEERDLLLRRLDCAVIETIHQFTKDKRHPLYDSVRGVFFEGPPLYPNAGFMEKNHIQICVRNPNCIKGYFIPRKKS